MPWQPDASMEMLHRRAAWLKQIRLFFDERGVLEVETPILSPSTIPDPHIESLKTRFYGQTYYLQTSPEFYMKRLLAAGSGSIYQLSHAFRYGELGRLHNPEFTLLEWYRPGYTREKLMFEVADLINELFPDLSYIENISYQALFQQYLDIDPLQPDWSALRQYCDSHGLEFSVVAEGTWDVALDWLLSCVIQPRMEGACFIYDYPATQASLAHISSDNDTVAKRFELYIHGVEIANGFEELTDSQEQRQRFEQENKKRETNGQSQIPLDEKLLSALDEMPQTSGVAVGLDRLLMLVTGETEISKTMAFSWQNRGN